MNYTLVNICGTKWFLKS